MAGIPFLSPSRENAPFQRDPEHGDVVIDQVIAQVTMAVNGTLKALGPRVHAFEIRQQVSDSAREVSFGAAPASSQPFENPYAGVQANTTIVTTQEYREQNPLYGIATETAVPRQQTDGGVLQDDAAARVDNARQSLKDLFDEAA